MGIYRELYDFAAKAGALEGYVYSKEKVDPSYLPLWVEHLVNQYHQLPPEVREDFQTLCDGTIGRAIQSLIPFLGDDHEVVKKLKTIVKNLPSSPNDFTYGR
ncbi:MAG: hypothetical protein ACPL6D_08435 [Thermodesulfobacteriota bacterium]